MLRKIIYAIWVLANIYLIFEWGKQGYQYYVDGNTTGAIVRLVFIFWIYFAYQLYYI